MSDELTPRKRKPKTAGGSLEAPRARKRSATTPPHGDALRQSPPDVTAVPVDAEPVRPGATRDERIARRAFELYEARRGRHGDPMRDWLEAERQVDAEIAAESPARD